MNRDELLEACFGPAARTYKPGKRVTEVYDDDGVSILAHLDINYRRVLVRRETRGAGQGIQDAFETLTVGAISNVCVAPDERGKGYGRQVLEEAISEIESHALIEFAAVFSDLEDFYAKFGFEKQGAPDDDFLVCSLRGLPWPRGTVDTQGKW